MVESGYLLIILTLTCRVARISVELTVGLEIGVESEKKSDKNVGSLGSGYLLISWFYLQPYRVEPGYLLISWFYLTLRRTFMLGSGSKQDH